MLSRIEWAMNVSLFLVAVGVAGEFIGNQIAGPIRKRVDAAKEAEIARLNKEAGEARKAAGEAMERAAALEKQAEAERLARMKIEERLAWRRIGPKEHSVFVAALKPFAGSTVEITKLGDSEAGQFADDIIGILAEAGWTVQLNVVGLTTPTYGLQCSIDEALPAGKALATVLGRLPTARIESAQKLPIIARVFVGLRLPP